MILKMQLNASVHKTRKMISLLSNWEGPYFFVKYKDGKGFQEQNHGSRICIFKYLKG
jgi:hypothetical protein